ALKTGVAYVALTLSIIAFSGLAQALANRIGVRPVLTAGLVLSAGGLVLYAQLPVHGQYFWDLFPAFMLSGIGLALAFVPMTIGALTGVQQSDAGVASGLINTSQQIGGAIGVAAATTIATTFTTHYVNAHPGVSALSGAALTHGFQITFYALAGISAAGAELFDGWAESFPGVETIAVDLQDGLDVARASMADYAAAIVRAAAGRSRPLAVCAWSLGGLAAMLAAAELEPEALVLLEPSPP